MPRLHRCFISFNVVVMCKCGFWIRESMCFPNELPFRSNLFIYKCRTAMDWSYFIYFRYSYVSIKFTVILKRLCQWIIVFLFHICYAFQPNRTCELHANCLRHLIWDTQKTSKVNWMKSEASVMYCTLAWKSGCGFVARFRDARQYLQHLHCVRFLALTGCPLLF